MAIPVREQDVKGKSNGNGHVGKSPGPKRSDLTSQRNRPIKRLFRFIRAIWIWVVIAAVVYIAVANPELGSLLLTGLLFLLQIAATLAFAILQFVAIFWFMSQTKTEVIRPGDPKTVTFDDYKGQPNLVKMVRQWMTLLSDRDKFQEMGGQFINGLLLYGEPGTGKTLLAKAMAGEAGIAFISIEGSGFRGMFWGVDVLRMIWYVGKARKLAREYGACVAYIDEIDAVGMSRGSVMGGPGGQGGGGGGMMPMFGVGSSTRWERLHARINHLFHKPAPKRGWHVLYLGSTNRPDVLDPALTRPGRFDRTIVVDKPDRSGRREIIKYYLSKIKHDDTVDVEAIVGDTAWATPAKIMSAITKDAVRLALFDDRNKVSQRDIELAFQEQAMGLENPIEEMQEDQRQQVAYHEAGHAIVQHYLRPDERIVRVSIIRRSEALGYVLPVPNYDIYAMPLRLLVADIMVSMAGHVAVKVFLGEYWTGASSDFQNIRSRVWTLASLGYFGAPIADPSSLLSNNGNGRGSIIDSFWSQAEEGVEKMLRQHSNEVEAVTQALLKRGDLNGKEVMEIITQTTGLDGNGNGNGKGELVPGSENHLAAGNVTQPN